MRPLGAVVLGAYADRHGRRKGLILTLALMSFGTLSIACSPDTHDRPLRAAAGSVRATGAGLLRRNGIGRRLGLSRRDRHAGPQGLLCSWQSGSQQVAVMFAARAGCCGELAIIAAADGGLGMAHPADCRLRHYSVPVPDPPLAAETEEFLARKRHPSIGEIMTSLAGQLAHRLARA